MLDFMQDLIRSATLLMVVSIAGGIAVASPTTDPSAPSPSSDRIPFLLDALRNGHDLDRQDACYALQEMGSSSRPAVPDLLKAARDMSWEGRAVAVVAAAGIAPDDPAVRAAVDRALFDPVLDVRLRILMDLVQVWPRPTWAVPALTKLIRDPDRTGASEAIFLLGSMGPAAAPAVPALIEAARRPESRGLAAAALGEIGPAAAPAVPALIPILGDAQRVGDVASAADALGGIGPAARSAAPKLAEVMRSGPEHARPDAAYALGRVDPAFAVQLPAPATRPGDTADAVRACHALGVALARDPTSRDAALKLAAAHSAGQLVLADRAAESVGDGILPPLVAALDSPDAQVRRRVEGLLFGLGLLPSLRHSPSAAAATRALAARLADPDSVVREKAAAALLSWGAPEALPAELQALRSQRWEMRMAAAEALMGLRRDAGSAPAAVAALMTALKDDNRAVRASAARTLGTFGSAARAAVPLLVEALRDRDAREIPWPPPDPSLAPEAKAMLEAWRRSAGPDLVRDAAALALGRIGPDAAPAAPALAEQLKDAKWPKRSIAIKSLGEIGRGAAPAVPVLAQLLHEQPVRSAAAEALARVGEPGVPTLVAALKDKDLRPTAVRELSRTGSAAVPALVAALSDPDAEVRAEAARALGGNGLRAAAAAPALKKALNDAVPAVRAAAAEALAKIDPAAAPR